MRSIIPITMISLFPIKEEEYEAYNGSTIMDKNEKTCPWCGGRSPLGTPCSAECEENHAKFQARAVWHKRFLYITIGICFLWLLRGTVPLIVRGTVVVVWAVWLCAARIFMPYSHRVHGCEKKTERESRIIGIGALTVLGAVLLLLYTLDSRDIYGILTWIASRRK